MPRYGSDLTKFLEQNGKRLPEGTVYRLAIQMLDVYQYMHSNGYVHADLKAANILLGLGKGGAAQAYLVDFGLASHFVTGDFKPDPKKMHNGTLEYTSRDAHLGVPTRRADLEILGYHLIEWLGAELPWVTQKLLAVPLKVQKAKEEFMDNIGEILNDYVFRIFLIDSYEKRRHLSMCGQNRKLPSRGERISIGQTSIRSVPPWRPLTASFSRKNFK
ncbi:uncharacterized protein Dsimw501_GD21309 [Drosophila simulans]|nr:uncharacterized protein Dsimw501_GD21309 [Drosophila simulans]